MSITIQNLNHTYNPGSPFETKALVDINLTIENGEFVGLIGHTGSGKSTLIQHLNGLLKPTSGHVIIDDLDTAKHSVKMKTIREKVGLVFQYPEHQLFEETVEKDISFGPLNLGLSEEKVRERVQEAMAMVGLSYESLKDRSPFDLSGGQRRRVAIAGVLAMKPDVLILDEPTASLDPRGRDEIFQQIQQLHQKEHITVILVSHSMEDIGRLVRRIVVMHQGQVVLDGLPREIFMETEKLQQMGLDTPQISQLMKELNRRGAKLPEDIFDLQEAKTALIKFVRGDPDA